MEFADQLKTLRKQAGLSQEQLANRIYVSRQAITKWENGAGRPEIENLIALADAFAVSMDTLLGITGTQNSGSNSGFRYENTIHCDIDGTKHFDIDCGSLYSCTIRAYDGEQLRIRIASNTIANLAQHIKTSIDDGRKRIDVAIKRGAGISETLAKEDVSVFLWMPQRYLATMECAAKATEMSVRAISCEELELDIRTQTLRLEDAHGHVEINCNLDMEIDCATLDGRIDINQLSATSHMTVPKNVPVALQTRGIHTRTIAGTGVHNDENAPNIIELNGMNSELIVDVR